MRALHSAHPLTLPEAERQVLGMDHAQVGALLAQRWQFPPEIVAAVAAHHDEALLAPGEPIGLPAVVLAANALASSLSEPAGPPLHPDAPAPGMPAALAALGRRLGQTPDETLRLSQDVARLTRELSDQLLHPPGHT